jgi:membrane protease YdiL (CAAX protease family)
MRDESLAEFGCYIPWALMQQTLLQFYLLGRLLVLFPKRLLWVPLTITAICFGLVHLPDMWTALVVVASGAVWCLIYYRYRLLLPLAFSHAALGLAFYYGIFGHDLAAEWRALLP